MQKFVLFDFDGVIADSFEISFEVAQMMHPHLTEDQYKRMWDGSIFGKEKEFACTPECRDQDFYTEYSPRSEKVSLIDGAAEFVRDLASRYTLVVISSSITIDVMKIAERTGIDRYFSDVMGKDVHTSKIEKINTILDRYEARTDDCVFVTDTLGDMLEAQKAGVDAIGVAWGYQYRSSLERGKPFRIVDEPQELCRAVDEYFAHARSEEFMKT